MNDPLRTPTDAKRNSKGLDFNCDRCSGLLWLVSYFTL